MSEKYHVLPLNDLKPHTESEHCKCQPQIMENGALIVHNAWDGREFDEIETQNLKAGN